MAGIEEPQIPIGDEQQISTPAAQDTHYDWATETGFDPAEDMTGALVGFENASAGYDLSETGIIVRQKDYSYQVVINGVTLKVTKSGLVYDSIPAGSSYIGQTLKTVTAEMGSGTAVGEAITRSGGAEDQDHSANVNVMAIEPRDSFAMQIMNAILIHADHPEGFSDEKWLYYARAAYKGAQAMMIAAADARHGQTLNPSQGTVTVNSDELQDNTEKLLYNIGQYMKTGVALKGEVVAAGGTPTPIQTKVTEMPDVTIDTMPAVTIGEMPDVAVKNAVDTNDDPIPVSTTAVITELPAVEVKNPLDTNDDPIPLTVDNTSASS